MNDRRPPSSLLRRFTSRSTTPLAPNEQTFANRRVAGSPEGAVYSSKPRSIATVLFPRKRASEDRISTGQPKVLLKSPPVPSGSTPSTADGLIGFPPSKNP